MATRRSSKKAEAPADPAPVADEQVSTDQATAGDTTDLIPLADLAAYLELPKGSNKDELRAVRDAAVEIAELYVGRKVTKPSHEFKMAVQLLAGRMYATGSLEVESFGALSGTVRYFLELVKRGK